MKVYLIPSLYLQMFFLEGGVQQIQFRTEGGEIGDLGVVAP
jgi:hypothetical protein